MEPYDLDNNMTVLWFAKLGVTKRLALLDRESEGFALLPYKIVDLGL